jgi:hypothetical protein
MAVPSLVTIDSSEPLEKMYEIVARDGGVIVSNFLTPELLKEAMDGSVFHHNSNNINLVWKSLTRG